MRSRGALPWHNLAGVIGVESRFWCGGGERVVGNGRERDGQHGREHLLMAEFFEYGDEYSETKYGNPRVLISEGEKMGS